MRILIVSQYYKPDIAGSSTRAFNVAKGLQKQGCKVKVIAAFPHYPHGKIPTKYKKKAFKIENRNGTKLIRVWVPALPHNSNANRMILQLCFALSSLFALPIVGGTDLIWAANPNLFSFFPALIYSFVKRKPIVRNVDDLWPEVFYDLGIVKSRILRSLLDFIARLSYIVPVAITPISRAHKRRIMGKYKIRKEKIHVVEVGVESVVSKSLSLKKNDPFLVMYSGILGIGYDFETVLEAARLLSDYSIAFLIRGVGEREPEIARMICELRLCNVTLDTRYLPKSKFITVLNSADAFLLPMNPAKAIEEGLPTKIFEYQSCGKPIICCSKGESAKYIESTRSGLVVRPKDPKALAEAILTLYQNRDLAQELALNGWKYVSENLTSEKIGESMYNIFLSILR